MNYKTTLVSFLIMALFIVPASAEYFVTATMETVQNSGSGNTWTTPVQFTLNLTDSKTMYGVTVNYADLGNSNTIALFRITGGTTTDAALAKNQFACIKGDCLMVNGTPSTVGNVRLTVTDIIQASTGITQYANSTATSDNVVTVFIQCSTGEKLNLNRNGANTYDPTMCNTRTGWSNSADKELNLYIHRNFNIPTSVNINTDGGYTEKSLLDNQNTRPYTLTSNSKYIFSIKTTRLDAWGGNIEETGTYTITITGLASTSGASTTTKIRGAYDVYLPATKSLDMGEKVTFTPLTGVEITSKANNNYEFDFRSAGTFNIKYKKADGTEDSIDFNVKDSAPQPKLTGATGNQQQGGDGGDLTRYLLGGGILTGIILIGYVVSKRKSSQPNMHVNPLKKQN